MLILISTREIESNNIRNSLFDTVSSSSRMQSFSSLRQKRKSSDADGYISPQKKKANQISVIIKQLNPYVLGAYFENEDGSTPYYWPLYKGLNAEEEWVKKLKIGMSVCRRTKDGPANEVMKHSNKEYLTWHIFVRFMTETELKKIDTVADTWGKNLCGAMNAYFLRQREVAPDKHRYLPKKYVFPGVEPCVAKLGNYVVQNDVVDIARFLFSHAIESREMFEQDELCELLFPGVKHPDTLFPELM